MTRAGLGRLSLLVLVEKVHGRQAERVPRNVVQTDGVIEDEVSKMPSSLYIIIVSHFILLPSHPDHFILHVGYSVYQLKIQTPIISHDGLEQGSIAHGIIGTLNG